MAAFKHLLEDGNVLVEVHYEIFHGGLVSRVFLSFSEGAALTVAVDQDTDQIVVSGDRPEKATEDVSSASPWRGVVGKPLYAE